MNKKSDPDYLRKMHQNYDQFTRNKQIKNEFNEGTNKYEIIEIANHTLRLLRDTEYENTFDAERKDVAVSDLMRMGEILKELK